MDRQVTEKEFIDFIKNYPRKLEVNFFMDWFDYYDFPENFESTCYEDTLNCMVARKCIDYDGGYHYYIVEREA